MVRSIEGVIEWARKNPRYTYKDGSGRTKSWAGLCEAFVNNAGDFDESFGNAMSAGDASGRLNPDWRNAPRGAIHYWAGVGGDGHVAFELGSGLLLMASSSVDDDWGTAVGLVTFERYARLRIPYRGWSLRHGTQTLAASATAGGGISPITPIASGDDDMRILKQPKGTIALVGEYTGRAYTAADGGQGFSIGANGKAWGITDNLTGDEITTLVNEAKVRRDALVGDVTASVLAALKKAGVGGTGGAAVDYAALAKAVNDDAARRLAA